MILDRLEHDVCIAGTILLHKVEPNRIPVIALGGRIYSLCIFSLALHHRLPKETQQKEAGSNFRLITYEASNTETASRSTVYRSPKNVEIVNKLKMKNAGQADIFLPLGYLIEPDHDGETGRITNYVWALNISTEPKSLWLIFDYMTGDGAGEEAQVTLDDLYSNIYNVLANVPYSDEFHYLPDGFLELGEPWDIVQVLDDIEKWQPDKPIELEDEDFEMRQQLGESLRAYSMNIPDSEYFELGPQPQPGSNDDPQPASGNNESTPKSWVVKAWSRLQSLSKTKDR